MTGGEEDADGPAGAPVVRIFRARARPGCEEELRAKLLSSSPALVAKEPGLLAYATARSTLEAGTEYLFLTVWAGWPAIRSFAGERWREAVLPPGYRELLQFWDVSHHVLLEAELRDCEALRHCLAFLAGGSGVAPG